MAKRLHDTDCWAKSWFRHLPAKSKILWLYCLDKCNCAGIWEIDFEQASFFTGEKFTENNLKDLEKQFKRIDEKRLLILDFIDFQYGELTETHKMRKKVFSILAFFDIKYPIDTLSESLDTVKDKDKDNIVCINSIDTIKTPIIIGEEKKQQYSDDFELFWNAYPRKTGKGAAWKVWGKIPSGTLPLILTALEWQCKQEQWVKEGGQFIPMPATYLTQARWEDQPTPFIKTNIQKRYSP